MHGSKAPLNDEDRRIESLSPIKALIGRLNEESVSYCSFKSNEHLEASLRGDCDLDLLVDRAFRSATVEALQRSGFKLFRSGPTTTYAAVEDWLALDQSGSIHHIHLHWELTLGQTFLKGYRLPFERLLLSHRTWDQLHEVFISQPEQEFVLLLVRLALKRSGWQRKLSRSDPRAAAAARELRFLFEISETSMLRKAAIEMLNPQLAEEIAGLSKDSLETHILRKKYRAIRTMMRVHRTFTAPEGFARRIIRIAQTAHGVLKKSTTTRPSVNRRQPHAGGLIVAIVGPDGSGKTTTAEALRKLLQTKLDVSTTYFGHGARGRRSLVLRGAEAIARSAGAWAAVRRSLTAPVNKAVTPAGSAPIGPLLLIRGVMIALRRRVLLGRAIRARNKGVIVICDRFPQRVDPGINDGPVTPTSYDSSRSGRRLRHLENRIMGPFALVEPDVVVQLAIEPAELATRNPKDSHHTVEEKRELFERHTYWKPALDLRPDATTSPDRLSAELALAIWPRF